MNSRCDLFSHSASRASIWKTGRGVSAAVCGILMLGGVCITGCVHANLPGETENNLAATDPNTFPAPKLMALSLEYVANRYPPEGGAGDGAQATFAFNLPAGMRPENVELVSSMLGGRGVAVTPENSTTLPIYHIATMWIRGSRAQVEMVFPVTGLTPGSPPVYRGVSLELGTDMSPWRVRRQQLWNVGTIPVPELHFTGMPAREAAVDLDSQAAPQEAPAEGAGMEAPAEATATDGSGG